jgi:Kunitz/Bovine pancreatic trypsin inhibitor domain
LKTVGQRARLLLTIELMQTLSLLRLALTAPLVALLAVSCGGSAFDSGGIGGSAGTGGASSKGGSSSVGGSNAQGGSATAGTGSGGGMPDLCTLPQDAGPCNALFPSWWHDPSTGVCMPFAYGGCQGNANRFATRAECQFACGGGEPNLDVCTTSSDCVLASPGCCAACDPVDDAMLVAINGARSAEYNVRCGPVACSPCPDPSELSRTRQYFVPACEAGQCTVLDLRVTSITECSDSTECALRDGAECCEGCDGQGLVAYNPYQSEELRQLICPDALPPCLACEPPIGPEFLPVCDAGRCKVQRSPLD